MLLNFLTSSLRNLLKYKIHSLINIGGLGIALAAVLTIGLYVEFERIKSSPSHIKNKKLTSLSCQL